ncbi:MAG: serine/threonine protein kinase [Planctomycetes bacterium]|nr:serine/threonine protein kinase [Planctomycetota bacterium]
MTPLTSETVSRAFEDMTTRARSGQPVRANDYFDPTAASSDPERVVDLVYGEYLARRESNTPASIAELVARFPYLAEQIRRQLQLHETLEAAADTMSVDSQPATRSPTHVPLYVGRYRIITELGAGGQGTVYRGFHSELGRDVVIKVAKRSVAPGEVDRLRMEAQVLASLDYPGLARVYDFDTHEGKPFLVMEFVGGKSLDAAAASQSISPKRAVEIVTLAAKAVGFAHGRGIVHRDLKPQNILLEETGHVRVIDFGLATLITPADDLISSERSITGTIRYMAPEQARGDIAAIGPWTDVFGLGGVLYFLLTGSSPYSGGKNLSDTIGLPSRGEWDRAKLQAAPVPSRIRAVCAKALSVKPADRYPNADALAAALRRATTRPRWQLIAAVLFVFAAFGMREVVRKPDNSIPVVPSPFVQEIPAQPEFKVRVWSEQQERYRDIIYQLPLLTGQGIRIEVAAPTDRHLGLFAVDASGEVRLLTETNPRKEAGTIAYPENPSAKSELKEPAGTVVLLLVGRAGSAVSLEEVRAALGADPWPKLPKSSMVVIEREKVAVAGTGRGVGPTAQQADPEGDVLRRLNAARAQLSQTCDVIAGAAFSHR